MNLSEFLFLHVSVLILFSRNDPNNCGIHPPLPLERGVAVKLLLFVSVWN